MRSSSDASTSTEDVKGRPLCLFYFTHPFGVLSPEPPTITAVPPNIARTYVDMNPVPHWSDSSQGYDTASTRPSYDLGNATIHQNPIKLVRNYGCDFRRDSISSLFSTDWFSSGSSRGDNRRVIPYTRNLPPLHMPMSRDMFGDSSEDMWPSKFVNREKFSLPPIELPLCVVHDSDSDVKKVRMVGVRKYRKRIRLSGLRRIMTNLMRRNVKGRHRHTSPALREALQVLREAWTEPRALRERWPAGEESSESCEQTNREAMWSGDVPARASPGLMRRRYSMPETIMRKYRLAQQRSDGDEGRSSASPASSPARGACAWCGLRATRRERYPMRKSALLRSWGRAGTSPARNCPCGPSETRSLDGSHTELHSAHRCVGLRRHHIDSNHNSDGTNESHTRPPSSNYLVPDLFSENTKGHSPRSYESKMIRNEHSSVNLCVPSTDRSLTDSSDTYTTSMPTTKEVPTANMKNQLSMVDYIDGRISKCSVSAGNEDSNILSYDRPLVLDTPSYDVLEIVVSETVDTPASLAVKNGSPEKGSAVNSRNLIPKNDYKSQIDIDEYVSNILVESLNSLTDQLETMNASICSDRKLSIVEKEIKVKLQNTGVNTIVHLSPTSNNQIIFGNEELYDIDRRNNRHDTCSSNIREELFVETNDNFTSAESLRDNQCNDHHTSMTEHFVNATPESVNKAVLQQIQKLFQEDLTNIEPEMNSPIGPLPGISHIEISNVDVFIDNNTNAFTNIDTTTVKTEDSSENAEVIGGIGTGNYYPDIENDAVVPRFSAFPHTESMEVNTSSSEDAEIFGSECASLVDSLDDPNSPRSILLRRSFSNHKRSELVRSAIDVLDLLPENINREEHSPKEKGESFFVRIKDDECDCEDKENVVVADHMPEQIKQRLYRRHRKRELRMECARRSRVKQMRKDVNRSRTQDYKSKKEIEKDCMVIINALIDEVIAKIAQDEYKCMRIKQRSNKISIAKSEDNILKRNYKKDSENNNRERRNTVKNGFSQSYSHDLDKQHRKTDKSVHSKLSVPTSSPVSTDDSKPKRIYQKSEFHDGHKRIEILEILEYVNSSQSSSETTTSDENHNLGVKNKKSRIPIPVSERIQKLSKNTHQDNKTNGNGRTPPKLLRERHGKSSPSISNISFESDGEDLTSYEIPVRRASVPCESRSRSNSLRFRNVFDIIPEERSSLSLESTGDDVSYNRRASAPILNEIQSNKMEKRELKAQKTKDTRHADTRSTGTSPMPHVYRLVTHNSVAAMTSPIHKSAATSPIRVTSGETRERNQGMAKRAQRHDEGSTDRRKSISTQNDSGRRKPRNTIDATGTIPAIFRLKREKKQEGGRSSNSNSVGSDKQSAEDVKENNKELYKQSQNEGRAGKKINIGKERRKEKKYTEHVKMCGRRLEEDENSSSSESSGSLLCSLAPAWLNARRRRRRASNASGGEWAVTVAGSCAAALPKDVEMRLRFPDPCRPRAPDAHAHTRATPGAHAHTRALEGGTDSRVTSRARRRVSDDGRLMFTVKKEASDSSILASKSVKKSNELLPNLETFRASRSKTRSSMKTRGCSLHCWLPADETPMTRSRDGLSVLGSAIVPERKPRAPTMSERDVTRRAGLERLQRLAYRC